MPKSDFVEIANFALETEALQFRSMLESHGIEAFADGTAAGTMLSYFGTALGGIRLYVKADDVAAATEVLQSINQADSVADQPWFCGKCHEDVDAGFHVCWSCGQPRAEVEQIAPPTSGESESPTTEPVDTSADEDATLMRAWRASIIGLVFFPLFTHLYSMCLLIGVGMSGAELSGYGQKRFYLTLAINLFAVVFWGSMLREYFR